MFNIPNILSILRLPLAFVFLQGNPTYRVLAISIALLTDGLDGLLARKLKKITRFGTLIDPITDKFFVFFVLTILVGEHKLTLWQAALMLCRDFSVIVYGFYLLLRKRFATYRFRAIWCGKVTTVLQLAVLTALTLGVQFPQSVFILFAILGAAALIELYFTDRSRRIVA